MNITCIKMPHIINLTHTLCHLGKGRVYSPKRMNFRKSSKQPSRPPPSFSENQIGNFSRIHDRRTVYNGKNLQYKFLDWKWKTMKNDENNDKTMKNYEKAMKNDGKTMGNDNKLLWKNEKW